MKNKTNYFEKVIKILKELNSDHPDVDVSKHLSLATSDYNSLFTLSDKELYMSLQKHKTEMDINTLSTKDLEKIITETEDFFNEGEYSGLDEDEDF